MDQSPLKKTKWAYILTRIFDAPFWAIFNMLSFILYKDLHATPFQIATLVTLKPLVSIFSSYWSTWTCKRRSHLVGSIVFARFLAFLPFFLYPWMSSPWFFICTFGLFMMLVSGSVPAWMEILKLNLPENTREKVFSNAQMLAYVIGGLFPYILGSLLDDYYQAWRWIFPVAAIIGLSTTFLQFRIPITTEITLPPKPPISISHKLFEPWKNTWNLLKMRPDFFRFQICFMLLGSGLMIIQPALIMFFVDQLKLSFTEMAVALAFFKGLGFLIGSPMWSKWINRVNIFYFCSSTALLAAIFPFILLFAKFSLLFLYISYFVYGFLQAGNELAWNLSGPIFSKKENSSVFSSVNVMAVGFRGCIIPFIGSWLAVIFSSSSVLMLGGAICLLATIQFAVFSRRSMVLDQT